MSLISKTITLCSNFVSLLFPNLCTCCGQSLIDGENTICLGCISCLPKTNLHLQQDNILEKKFWGKANIERATAFCYYQKNSEIQHLIHKLKYKNGQNIGIALGKYAGAELSNSKDFNAIDLIVPVPLHWRKLQKRGYNQSLSIANGLAEVMGRPIDNTTLLRLIDNPTQTKKSTFGRWQNTKGIFGISNPQNFAGKHILLIDDVLTTGSTIIACVDAILDNCENSKISVFTIAAAV